MATLFCVISLVLWAFLMTMLWACKRLLAQRDGYARQVSNLCDMVAQLRGELSKQRQPKGEDMSDLNAVLKQIQQAPRQYPVEDFTPIFTMTSEETPVAESLVRVVRADEEMAW